MANGTESLLDFDRETGEWVQGWPRAKQSIYVILTTRKRMRVMRRWWGSEFLNMQDKPGNQETIWRSIGDAAQAINDYEPEFQVESLIIDQLDASGNISVTVNGTYLPDNTRKRVSFSL